MTTDPEYQCVMQMPTPEITLHSYFWILEMRVVWLSAFGLPRSWPMSRKRRRKWLRRLDRRIAVHIPVLQDLYSQVCCQCHLAKPNCAPEEGDAGYWCLDCINAWETKHGERWADGTPLDVRSSPKPAGPASTPTV